METSDYVPTPGIKSISSLKPVIMLREKRYLLVGIIFGKGYHYFFIFVDNWKGEIGSTNIFYDGMSKNKVVVYDCHKQINFWVRGLMYVMDPDAPKRSMKDASELPGTQKQSEETAHLQETDHRQKFIICDNETENFPSEEDMLSLRECLEGYKHWEPLTGGKTNGKSTRKYSMDLDKHDTTLHAKIESIMMPVITSILKIPHP